MALYSAELRNIVKSGVKIFDFPYPFYDENKRREFEQNFIRHFYFREIGAETADRFKLYLEDKMLTVFPYYNELFKTAQIEYNILDNYNIREEYEINRENIDKTSGVSSSVGQVKDNQTTEGNENVNVEGLVNTSTETNTNLAVTGENEMTKDSSMETASDSKNVKKFLDTPQGKLNLDEVDYLTNLTQDEGNANTSGTSTETTNGSDSKNEVGNTEQSGSTTSNDKTDRTSSTVFNGEQRTTQDNNTRTEAIGNVKETSVYTKKGNIGVDTDADMIQKHINLQKILRKIELMFFEECEDLFMLVF